MKKLLAISLLATLLLTACTAANDDKKDTSAADTTAEEATTKEETTAAPDPALLEGAFGFSFTFEKNIVAPGEYCSLQVSMTNQMDSTFKWTGVGGYYRPKAELVSPDGTVYEVFVGDGGASDDYDYYSAPSGETRTYGASCHIPYDASMGKYDLVCHFKNSYQTFEDVLEVGSYEKEAYSREDAFGFTYEGTEGTFARNERIRVDVAMTNQMDCDYEWLGSSSSFHANVYLVSAEDPTYEIHDKYIAHTDDHRYNKVAPGESNSRTFNFQIPDDAPAGKYNLVCRFRYSARIFEGLFELE